MARLTALVALLGVLLAPAAPAALAQQQQTFCNPGTAPDFTFGFADLRGRLGDWMGDPITCEFPDPNGSGDVHQRTTRGLAFWRKATNTSTFTDGGQHWGLSPDGFLFWTGDSIDPPAGAPATDGNPACASTICAFRPPPLVQPPTYNTAKGPKTEQQLHDELAAAGYSGPWDVPSMVDAFNKAAQGPPPVVAQPGKPNPPSPPPPPAPTPRKDFSADCQAFANTLPGRIGNKILLLSNIILGCTQLANHDGQPGLACYEAVLQKEIHDSIIYTSEDFVSRYDDCLGGKPT